MLNCSISFSRGLSGGGSVIDAVATGVNPRVVGSNLVHCFYFSELHCTDNAVLMDGMDWSQILDSVSKMYQDSPETDALKCSLFYFLHALVISIQC